MMNGALRIDFWFKGARDESKLRALNYVEVVVGGMATGVAFCANGGSEDDEILC